MSRPPSPDSDADRKSQEEAKRQEEALKDTFPASDPVPASGNQVDHPTNNPSNESHIQADLDESLKQSFPASDPPALSDPDHEDH